MRENIIGRKEELQILNDVYHSSDSEFVAICGRRRIGKTYLVKEYYEKELVFQTAGMANSGMKEQIKTFYNDMLLAGLTAISHEKPKDWIDIFFLLRQLIDSFPNQRKVILLDELPWMDTPKSGFLQALEHFWNSWACGRHDIVLVVCGSATSWMMDKLINNHGGLHNRLTRRIFLRPFTLLETEQFLLRKGFHISRYDTATLYMIMGGVPYYLNMLQPHLSIAQNIDTLFFNHYGAMYEEFRNLYAALFKNSDDYIKVVKALCTKKSGLTRNEIIETAKLNTGGGLTTILNNLEYCGFIRKYNSPSMSKADGIFYQLIDFYTLFYFRFLEQVNTRTPMKTWSDIQGRQEFNTWKGLTFEMLCLHCIDQIKTKLGINGIATNEYPWRSNKEKGNAQIDLIIDRADNCINLCEMKFSINEYSIDAEYERNLRNKIAVMMEMSGHKKSVLLTMITTYGIERNSHSSIVNSVITLDELF